MASDMTDRLNAFFDQQMEQWPLLAENTRRCGRMPVKRLAVGGDVVWRVQLNEAREVSTGADVSAEAIAARRCFLCRENRPQQQGQIDDLLPGYSVLANPYPIVPGHLVIASQRHEPQLFTPQRASDLFRLCEALPGHTAIFNGPRSGASAPDHFHFQAVPKGSLPLEDWVEDKSDVPVPYRHRVWHFSTPRQAAETLEAELAASRREGWDFNMVAWRTCAHNQSAVETHDQPAVVMVMIPRRAHRPDFYGTGEGQMLVSPGAIDLSGVIVLPRRRDFDRITSADISETLRQTCFPQP